jgi:hypothetical protein
LVQVKKGAAADREEITTDRPESGPNKAGRSSGAYIRANGHRDGPVLHRASRRRRSVLYDSTDLTTHAVIVGMTGSGKTGLGITIIEEALLNGIPCLVIDQRATWGTSCSTSPT